jgi:1,4-dihydroxy-2-naphthoate octaprenyltransferase
VDALRPWLRAGRPAWLLVTLNPVLLGSVYAAREAFPFRAGAFALATAGSIFAHIGICALREIFDPAPDPAPPPAAVSRVLAFAALGLALLCALALVPLTGATILGLAFAGLLLGVLYAAPPLPVRELGGLGELAVFLVFGPLLVLGGYYSQSSELSFGALMAALPLGLLTAAAFYGEHFVHARQGADVMCPVRLHGEAQARLLLFAIVALGYLSIVLNVSQEEYPVACLAAILTAVPLAWKLLRLESTAPVEAYREMTRMALALTMAAGALIVIGFLLSRAADV